MTQKEIAVECLQKLDIYKPYIRRFEVAGVPCFFERFGGFYVDQEPWLFAKIKEIEKEYGCSVYALTHELFTFGECWSMLCVSKHTKEVRDCLVPGVTNHFYAYAYVWNNSDDMLSEFGDIAVQALGGGLRRIG